MIQFLKKIFNNKPEIDFAILVKKGAIIVDVRTPAEFKQGHIHGAINIPLNELSKHISKIGKDQIIITCCASGIRSATAAKSLKTNHFNQVYNGGSWNSLQNKID